MTDVTPKTDTVVDRLLAADPARPPRADARRNVRRLVDAAREALTEVGADVGAHEIARRAGVGIGTFYRRVGSREALLGAVLAELMDESVAVADRALDATDPWAGFARFATEWVRLRATICGLNEVLGEARGFDIDESIGAIRDRVRLLVTRAQEAGAMRTDLDWRDVPFLLTSVIPGDHTIGLPAAEDQWRRSLRVILDGLRARPQ